MNRLTLSLTLLCLYCACSEAVSDDPTSVHAREATASARAGSSAPDADAPDNIEALSAALSGAPLTAAELAASVNSEVASWIPSQPWLSSIRLRGAPFTMVKNWTFGRSGNIRNYSDLSREFEYHDQFGTIANGSNYGAVTVAADPQTAISAQGLGLIDDRQPVENPARPYRQFTANSMLAHVRPLSPTQSTVSARRHDVGNGSIMSKWALPKGGKALGRTVVWETRVRMPASMRGYWFALWTAGNRWNHGAEMDVVESFGTEWVRANAFHSDSVGGSNAIDYRDWFRALTTVGVPEHQRHLRDWHTWTWVYSPTDVYSVYYDGYLVQRGMLRWTLGGEPRGEELDMRFLFDFSWGHTQVSEVNLELPAAGFQLTYEIAYSRVWVR